MMGFFKKLKEKIFGKKEDKNLDENLSKTRKEFSKKLDNLSRVYKKIDSNYFNQLEEILIEADCGVNYTLDIIEKLSLEIKKRKISDTNDINELLFEIMFDNYNKDIDYKYIEFKNKTEVLLIVGVNGVGKTTTIAKLANYYADKKILFIAADTFRAGAKEQLNAWANFNKIDIFLGKENEDPSSVVYDGVKSNIGKYDLIIIDTAGRLQTSINLMDELSKISRVINKVIDYEFYTYLVLDATTGQNGISQAKSFMSRNNVSGLIVTKLDGTSKGGILLAIKKELNLPVLFIGYGERVSDFDKFDIEKYVYSICKDFYND